MKKFYRLSDSEMEIMRVIWGLDAPITVAQLLSMFHSREWKTQTMATFLTRLADKGLLMINREARSNVYTPAITEQTYRQREAQDLLRSVYNGSLQGFLSALYAGGEVDAAEAGELKKWLEGMKENA